MSICFIDHLFLRTRDEIEIFSGWCKAHKGLCQLAVALVSLAILEYLPELSAFLSSPSPSGRELLLNFFRLAWTSFPFYLALCAPVCFLPATGTRIYLILLLPLLTFLMLFNTSLQFCFHVALSGDVMHQLLNTNRPELSEFIGSRLTFPVCLTFFSFFSAGILLSVILIRANWFPGKRCIPAAFLLLCPLLVCSARFLLIGLPGGISYRVTSLRLVQETIQIHDDWTSLHAAAVNAPQLPADIRFSFPQLKNLLGIIVIGESATRSHHGLYGYIRNTTPHLSQRKEQLYCFKQVLSAAPVTAEALKYTFTFSSLFRPSDHRCTFASILKRAGFRTVLLSTATERCSINSLLFHGVDRSFYSAPHCYDDKLAAELPQMLSGLENDPTIVFVHLQGSHFNYENRYPQSHRVFTDVPESPPKLTPEEIASVNHYDNSIAFTDHVLEQLIQTASQSDRPAFLLYFSDHGENPTKDGGNSVRNPASTDNCFYEIPFFVWLSDSYRKARPEFAEAARNNCDKPMQMDRGGIYSLCDIAGIRFAHFPETNTIFNRQFRNQSRFILTPAHPYSITTSGQ